MMQLMRFPKKGKGNDGTWHSIETAESHRKLNYNNSTTTTIKWEKDTLLFDFLFEIKINSWIKYFQVKHILSAIKTH